MRPREKLAHFSIFMVIDAVLLISQAQHDLINKYFLLSANNILCLSDPTNISTKDAENVQSLWS